MSQSVERIRQDIEAVARHPAAGAAMTGPALPEGVAPSLLSLWSDYSRCRAHSPTDAAYLLYDAMALMEPELQTLAHSASVSNSPLTQQESEARQGLRRLPRNIRLLGVSLGLE